MRRIVLGAAVTAAVAAGGGWAFAAAAPGRAAGTTAPLDCPARQGGLVRTETAPDGSSCLYAGPNGEQVRLSRLALHRLAPTEAVEPLKAALRAQSPVRVQPVRPIERTASGDDADIDLPFFHIHAHGDRADVRVFGVRVHADGENAVVHTNLGLKNTVVHAGAHGAEIVAETVDRRRAELVYVLAAEKTAATRYPVVGYVAKGPAHGPLVVGEFRMGQHQDRGVSLHDSDISRLIDRNAS